MNSMNFLRVGAAVPEIKIGNPDFNTEKICQLWDEIEKKQVDIVVFPELTISGYSCGELFNQDILYQNYLKGMWKIVNHSKNKNSIIIVGSYLNLENKLYNCAFLIYKGNILAGIPKTYLPSKQEFYEKRWFVSGRELSPSREITLLGQTLIVGNVIIRDSGNNFSISAEICEDLWAPIPPSSFLYLQGADIIFNLSASDAIVAKSDYRRSLVSQQSARFNGSYIYTSAGVHESSTDYLMDGHSLIAENGTILKENQRFQREGSFIFSDIDLDIIKNQRQTNSSFAEAEALITLASKASIVELNFEIQKKKTLERVVNKMPFVPQDDSTMALRCEEIFSIQSGALAKRLEHTHFKKAVIGISGGLDSTLAFLAAVKTFKLLSLPPENIVAITMPGFGTTDRTYSNAIKLIKSFGADFREIDIKEACLHHFNMIGHNPEIHDVTYENVQARERTEILMNLANKEGGLVIGTGDLSELALGWCTYNGDHMSMYSVNSGIPKTLVRHLVKWFADTQNLEIKNILYSILDTPVSPELLPVSEEGDIQQKTEDIIGPYLVHDFFLYNFIKYGYSPKKILYLSSIAFKDDYSEAKLKEWLKLFLWRFFTQQFKRSCLPDGPKVGSISLSPRGDWKMPSDGDPLIWLENI